MNTLLEAAKAVISVADAHNAVKSDGASITALRATIAAEDQRLVDEQLPATKEWLTEVMGFEPTIYPYQQGFGWYLSDHVMIVRLYPDGVVSVGWGSLTNPTRRQVLCLLEAMGVKL